MNSTHRRIVIAAGAFLGPLGYSLPASATEEFPSRIYHHLYSSYTVTPYEPPCSLCHVRGSTGDGTAQTSFARALKARGLQPEDDSSLFAALDAMNRDNVDSDGDGTPDIQEIVNNTDPNSPAPVSLTGHPGPNAGCGGGQREDSSSRPASAMGLAGALVMLWLRRRKHPA
jgi:hypothetical protein